MFFLFVFLCTFAVVLEKQPGVQHFFKIVTPPSNLFFEMGQKSKFSLISQFKGGQCEYQNRLNKLRFVKLYPWKKNTVFVYGLVWFR